MPSWPIEMPSLTVIVPNSRGKPPASRTPTLACSASLRSVMLHGVTSFHDEAMPICGLSQSSSVMPTARSIARDGAFCMPSVTSRERGLMSTGTSIGESFVLEASLMACTVVVERRPPAWCSAHPDTHVVAWISNTGCFGPAARSSSSVASGPTPSKNWPTSHFHRRR